MYNIDFCRYSHRKEIYMCSNCCIETCTLCDKETEYILCYKCADFYCDTCVILYNKYYPPLYTKAIRTCWLCNPKKKILS